MEFEFSPEQLAFRDEVEAFLDANDDPVLFDVTRENMAQIADTPDRARSCARSPSRAGSASRGRQSGAARRATASTSTCSTRRSRRAAARRSARASASSARRSCATAPRSMKKEFLPKILAHEIEFAVGYSEPDAGSDAASMKLKARATATAGGSTARRPGPPPRTSPTGTGWARAPIPRRRSTTASRCSSCPLDHPGITINGDLDDGRRAHQRRLLRRRVRARRVRRRRLQPRVPVHLRGARPRAVHDVHLLADRAAPRPLCDYVATETVDDEPLRDDPASASRSRASRPTPKSPALLGLRVVAKSMKGGAPPTSEVVGVQAVRDRVVEAARQRVDGHRRTRLAAPRAHRQRADEGRAESTYRYTVIDTIGGGASEIQKNIISRRKLGLPKNF